VVAFNLHVCKEEGMFCTLGFISSSVVKLIIFIGIAFRINLELSVFIFKFLY
jgi:hypothetical protein